MTTDEARDYFKSKGLSYEKIDEADIERLMVLIREELAAYLEHGGEHAKEMDMSLRKLLKKHIKVLKSTGLQYAYLRVEGSYFHDREGISFNKDGFIGFGGEFSTKNVQPLLKAFCRWCDELEELLKAPTTYVVCQTGRCQQTYPLEYFGVITKDTKNINCEKCGGILIDENGKANLSQNPYVIPVIKPNEIKKEREEKLKQKHAQLKALQAEIELLESSNC